MANASKDQPQNGSKQNSDRDKSEAAQSGTVKGDTVALNSDELTRLRILLSAVISDELMINPMAEELKPLLIKLGVPIDEPAVSLPPPRPNLG